MGDLSWRDAIIRVLKASPDSMHYTEIAEAIAEQGLKMDVGATPAQSVSATISVSLRNEGASSYESIPAGTGSDQRCRNRRARWPSTTRPPQTRRT